jgi:hypothetical protein
MPTQRNVVRGEVHDLCLEGTQRTPSPIHEEPPVLLDDTFDAFVVGDAQGQEDLDHGRYAELASNIYQDGTAPLIQAAFDDEQATGSRYSRKMSFECWVDGADQVLCSMDEDVILEACAGNLPKACADGQPSLAERLDEYEKRGDSHPSIYMRPFCHAQTSEPLTIERAKLLVREAVAYARQDEEHNVSAYKIDRVFDRRHC